MINKNVLFQDKVYSTGIDLWDIPFGDEFSIISENQNVRDEHLYPNLLDKDGNPKKFSFIPGAPLFLFNDEVTWVRNRYQRMIRDNQLNLFFSKDIIADDHYPVYVEYIRPFKRFTRKREMALFFGEYQLTFGRAELVDMIRICRYDNAWPQVREIMLHDEDLRMKNACERVFNVLNKNISLRIVCDTLQHLHSVKRWARYLISLANEFPSPELVPYLENIFSQEYYYYPTKKMYISEIYGGSAIQNELLRVCEKIPTIASLRLLEEAVSHPYVHVEQQAFNSISNWVNNTAKHLSSSPKENHKSIMIEIENAINKYDVEVYDNSYRKLSSSKRY